MCIFGRFLRLKGIYSFSAHSSGVEGVAFAPNNPFILATAGWDSKVNIWNLRQKKLLKSYHEHQGRAVGIAFSPDASKIASVASDSTIKIWESSDTKTLHSLQTFAHPGDSIRRVAFSPGGRLIASSSKDGSVQLWDTDSNDIQIYQDKFASSACFSDDNLLLLCGDLGGKIRLIDVATMHNLWSIQGHPRSVTTLLFLPQCKQFASGSFDGTIKIWDTQTGRK